MSAAYELALLGAPSADQVAEIQDIVVEIISHFDLSLGKEVTWLVRPPDFTPSQRNASAALFFGSPGAAIPAGLARMRISVPVIPIVSDLARASSELPPELRSLNALAYGDAGARRVATALLECAGLLPRQRRVFVSYRRDEARAAALQLFDAFSARQFDVFLDTHGVAPGDDFQSTLWHRLCDSDVLVMLDTKTYFASRWTTAEFGRALAKNISVLRVAWPDCTPSPRTSTASHVVLADSDLDAVTGMMADHAIEQVCSRLEVIRSESIAVRRLNLVSGLAYSLELIGGKIEGIGLGNGVYLTLPDGRQMVAFPTVGVPTSLTLHQAVTLTAGRPAVVLYDHIGLHQDWLEHLDWLATHISRPRWVKAAEAAWQLADWVD
jgi:hypothetical protein